MTIDSETGFITSLLLPRPFLVTDVRRMDTGDVEVELEISQARHYLRRDHSSFEQTFELLDTARRAKTPVLVTESLDGTAIVDVRPASPDALSPPPPPRRGK